MRISAFACVLWCIVTTLPATTVRPPTFDELVGDAELAFRGRVIDIRTDWAGAGDRRYIATCSTATVA